MAQWLERDGKRVLRMDLEGMSIEQYVKEVELGAQMVLAAPASSLLPGLLVVGTQPDGSLDEAKRAWQAFQAKTRGRVGGQAVVGLRGFKRVVARLVRHDLYFASSEEDALRYLLRP